MVRFNLNQTPPPTNSNRQINSSRQNPSPDDRARGRRVQQDFQSATSSLTEDEGARDGADKEDSDEEEDDDSDEESESDLDSVDTAELLRQGALLASDDEDAEPYDEDAEPYDEAFRFNAQELADTITGAEDPVAEGWDRHLLATNVNTRHGTMSLARVFGCKQRVLRKQRAQQEYDDSNGRVNNYHPQLHITQNAVPAVKMLVALSNGHFKTLQNLVTMANSTNLNAVDYTALIPASMHKQMQIDICAYYTIHAAAEEKKPWLKGPKDGSWKNWSPALFFTRILRVYVPDGVSRESALLNQLKNVPLKYEEKDNFIGVSIWLQDCEKLMTNFDEREFTQRDIVKTLLDRLKDIGGGRQTRLSCSRTAP